MEKEPFMPTASNEAKEAEQPKQAIDENASPKKPEDSLAPYKFTYPDGLVGYANSRKEAADKIEEYRAGQK